MGRRAIHDPAIHIQMAEAPSAVKWQSQGAITSPAPSLPLHGCGCALLERRTDQVPPSSCHKTKWGPGSFLCLPNCEPQSRPDLKQHFALSPQHRHRRLLSSPSSLFTCPVCCLYNQLRPLQTYEVPLPATGALGGWPCSHAAKARFGVLMTFQDVLNKSMFDVCPKYRVEKLTPP